MTIDRVSRTRAQATQTAAPVDAAGIVRGLERFAPFNVNAPYGGTIHVAKEWFKKDAGSLRAWENAGAMGPTFRFVSEMNMGDGGDYLGRALQQNMDASIWTQSLVKAGVIREPAPPWRAAIEVASLALDIGNDGAGRTGYSYVLTGVDGYPSKSPSQSVKMPAGLQARAALLVGGSGGGGFHVEKAYADAAEAPKFGKRLLTEGTDIQGLLPRAADKAHTERELALLDSGALLATQADREAFADALLVVKLADRSRGAALKAYDAAGGGDAGLEALKKHRDWAGVVTNYEKHKAARKD